MAVDVIPALAVKELIASDIEVKQDLEQFGIEVNYTFDSANAGAGKFRDTSVGDNFVYLAVGGNASRATIYAKRDLPAANTAAPVVTILQKNANDDKVPLEIENAIVAGAAINFTASARGIIAAATPSTESVRVSINGTVYRLALYVDA